MKRQLLSDALHQNRMNRVPKGATMTTTTTQHTELPWRAEKGGSKDEENYLILGPGNCWIADVNDADDTDNKANAAFIVQAVNSHAALVAACQALIKALDAQITMRDMKRPRKLDEHLCWVENDELAATWGSEAKKLAEAALQQAEGGRP